MADKKITAEDFREAFTYLVENNLHNLDTWLQRVAIKNPAKAIELVRDLAEFVIPKLNRTDIVSSDDSFSPTKKAADLFPSISEILKQAPKEDASN
jgi:hypothetical protein